MDEAQIWLFLAERRWKCWSLSGLNWLEMSAIRVDLPFHWKINILIHNEKINWKYDWINCSQKDQIYNIGELIFIYFPVTYWF